MKAQDLHCVFRVALILVATCLISVSSANAASSETACGWYEYSDQAFAIRFLNDLDGFRDVTIDGKFFQGPFKYAMYGRSEGFEDYSVSIADGGITKVIRLSVLFSDEDDVVAVGAMYYEYTVSADDAFSVANVRIFQPKFTRVELEDLPSSIEDEDSPFHRE